MPATAHDPSSFKRPHPLYSSYTTAPLSPTTTLVTVAGQVAEDIETGVVPSGLEAQLDLCLSRLTAILEDAGAKKTDLTRLMYYISQHGVKEYEVKEGEGAAVKLIGGKVGAWLEGNRPASCFLRVFGMTDDRYLCEFECMAMVTKEP
ncbi:hypothetical protein NA57DRAFT_72173 [Rhizodiscina lignyota]|uniref:YjgF-like protein n=1 Tax=Rhizodiscina lignyota TaxID=1504668 RepID=A0A9P4IPU3_9PEZI|nr:hypothetical protein NA57DRAFT_72173 [Rhizodiscina lignyota]